MRRLSLLTVAPLVCLPSCGGDDDDPYFLGPVDGGAVVDAPAPDVQQPALGSLTVDKCTGSNPLLAEDPKSRVRSLAVLDQLAVVAAPGSLYALRLDASGCPSGPFETFGDDGVLALDASAAVPLVGSRTLVAAGQGTSLLDSTGAEIGTCGTAGLVLRTLQGSGNEGAVGVVAQAPLTLLATDLEQGPAYCTTSTLPLSPAPFAVVQVAADTQGGFVTVEQATPSSPLAVSRYGADGTRSKTSAPFAGTDEARLCSASGLVDSESGVLVVDATCRRVVLFDRDALFAKAEARFDGEPRGAARVAAGASWLVTVARASGEGTVTTFERVLIP